MPYGLTTDEWYEINNELVKKIYMTPSDLRKGIIAEMNDKDLHTLEKELPKYKKSKGKLRLVINEIEYREKMEEKYIDSRYLNRLNEKWNYIQSLFKRPVESIPIGDYTDSVRDIICEKSNCKFKNLIRNAEEKDLITAARILIKQRKSEQRVDDINEEIKFRHSDTRVEMITDWKMNESKRYPSFQSFICDPRFTIEDLTKALNILSKRSDCNERAKDINQEIKFRQ